MITDAWFVLSSLRVDNFYEKLSLTNYKGGGNMEVKILIKNSVILLLCTIAILYITKNTELIFALVVIANALTE